MLTYNVFLNALRDSKGGGVFLENPAVVENIVWQTAARAPDAFESALADGLMAVFSAGIWELDAVVAALNTRGHLDAEGGSWTVASFQAQLAQCASRLFAAVD